ncbi:DUF3231 family protein [Shouchella shacheensis]|uniref:DUF3231 family protein n=1 Tax=Shouchella shacheensis TaxID=1649580 RepID=UPI0007402BBF|nr:DUF3231 family protein [Shouchella shacheensis]
MANVFEVLRDYVKTTMDNEPKNPPHIGEAYGCWLYFSTLAEELPILETALNTTMDDELIQLTEEAKKLGESQLKRVETFMLKEGIPLSRSSEHKPPSDPNSVPLGVKTTDYEIANVISVKVATNITMCATNLSQSIRSDIGLMWTELQSEKAMYGMKLKTAMRKRGWIKVPPYYSPPGLPKSN